jgi:hypothetical protein
MRPLGLLHLPYPKLMQAEYKRKFSLSGKELFLLHIVFLTKPHARENLGHPKAGGVEECNCP